MSKYTEVVTAISQWDSLGCVRFYPDVLSTHQDLQIYDIHSSDTAFAQYDYDALTSDEIWFNKRILDGFNTGERTKTALHELGHALDFDHNTLEWPESILRQGRRDQPYLGDHDLTDYVG